MSKIEDALRKAELARSKSLVCVDENKNQNEKLSGDVKTTAPLQNQSDTVQYNASTKDIALMDCGELLDNDALSELKIIFSDMGDNKTANTYRDLRTKLIQQAKGKNFIAMVTSCTEGKSSSLASLNISTAFSFDESKTSLLIDCDLNNPKLDALVNMQADKGLTDYMENESIKVDSIMHKTGIKRLKMIPAGTVREIATEYFTSLRMRRLMSDLLARYTDRYIFLDTAPIVESADTRILVELCDFVILVVPYGRVTKSKINEAVEAIGSDKLLGIVFNEKPVIPKFSFFDFFKG